ncbi:MAG: HupE/UreJ family protein [Xanthobacteraceae bacterium]
MSFRGSFSWRRVVPIAIAAAVLPGLSSAALAHVGIHAGGFADGLAHPFSGLDHVLAMVAIGLWASQLGRPAYWLLPVSFPAVMALGAVLGANNMPLPWVEIGIAASVIVLGAVIALSLKPSLLVSTTLIAAFALLHGHSHGAELPQSASALAYGAGFLAATLVLHAIGLAFGAWSSRPAARLATRTAGVAIAAVGAVLLMIA